MHIDLSLSGRCIVGFGGLACFADLAASAQMDGLTLTGCWPIYVFFLDYIYF